MSDQSIGTPRQAVQPPQGWVYEPPRAKASWIGYDRRTREIGHPQTGEVLTFRPSVYVREFASIRVKEVERKTATARNESFTYGAVKFDAESLGVKGFSIDITANVADSEALVMLEQAHQAGHAVSVVIETYRRQKVKKSSDDVPVTAPIWELRGAETPEGKSEARTTLTNCRTVVAAVAPAGNPGGMVFSPECVTDPTEWSSMRRNYDATRSPAGWVKFEGGVIPSQAKQGAELDVEALADAVAARLSATGGGPEASPREGSGRSSGSRRGHTEAAPWYPTNADGSLNLGGYIPAKERATFQDALGMLTRDGEGPADLVDQGWKLARVLLWAADSVQMRVLGSDSPDRNIKSHYEAARWVSLVIDHVPGHAFPGAGADQTAWRDWIKAVADTAAPLFEQAARETSTYLGRDAGPSQVPAPAESEQPAPAAAQSDATQPDGDPQTVMADQSRELVERYRALLAATNLIGDPTKLQPLLAKTFSGARMLGSIPAAAFEPVLSRWEADPGQFISDAGEAFNAASQSVPA